MIDADLVDSAVSLLYEAVLDESQWDAAMAALARAFDAPMAAHWRFDFKNNTATEFRGHGHDLAVQQRYTQHYHQLDPGVPCVFKATVGTWYGDEELFDRRARDQQEYTVDFALPSDIGWVGGGKLQAESAHAGLWFGVQRNFDAKPFGTEGQRLFSVVAPHLQRAARIASRIKQQLVGQVLAQASLDALKSAVCVVDATRRIHLVNRAADHMLAGADVVFTRNGRIMTSPAAQDERLAACVTLACARLPRGSAMLITRPHSLLPTHAMVVPIPQRHALASLFHEPLALLFVMDPEVPHLPSETYQAMFHLTNAEAALLFALVNGRTVSEWSVDRGIRLSTVRTQLNSVFAKTGVDSQARLLRIARTLPAVD